MESFRFPVWIGWVSRCDVFSGRILKRDLLSPLAGMLPSPTITRAVSGSAIVINPKQMAASIARNPNIHLQLACCASRPPKRGPRVGATCGLENREQ